MKPIIIRVRYAPLPGPRLWAFAFACSLAWFIGAWIGAPLWAAWPFRIISAVLMVPALAGLISDISSLLSKTEPMSFTIEIAIVFPQAVFMNARLHDRSNDAWTLLDSTEE